MDPDLDLRLTVQEKSSYAWCVKILTAFFSGISCWLVLVHSNDYYSLFVLTIVFLCLWRSYFFFTPVQERILRRKATYLCSCCPYRVLYWFPPPISVSSQPDRMCCITDCLISCAIVISLPLSKINVISSYLLLSILQGISVDTLWSCGSRLIAIVSFGSLSTVNHQVDHEPAVSNNI
jgi:hypothetical protein